MSSQSQMAEQTIAASSLIPPAPEDASATHPMLLSLPDEVLGRVLQFLSSSKEALCACALTCKSFLPGTRIYLLSNLTLQSYDDFSAYLHDSYTTPALASYVRRLRIRNVGRDAQVHWEWPVQVPLLLGSRLGPRLQEFSLACPLMDPHPTFFVSLSFFVQVTTLELAGPIYLSLFDLIRTISSFPSLENLTMNLDGIRWPHFVGDCTGSTLEPLRLLRSKLHLRSLSVLSVDSQITELVDWIISSPSVSTLRKLWFEFWDAGVIEAISRLITACGSSLEDLTLDSCCGGISADILGWYQLLLISLRKIFSEMCLFNCRAARSCRLV